MTQLPTEFINMLHDLLGDEASDLIKALDTAPVTSVRLNKRKPGAEFHDTTPVAWCKSGLYLKERPEFILDPLLHAGAYYVQDASSMIYETVIDKLLPKLYEDNGYAGGYLKLLDLCAAPGGKTTAMINALPDGSRITANEFSSKRVNALKENIAKWGYPFVDVTNRDTSYYAGKEEFDIVAVDAPCSGEGMMRKDETARTQWSYNLIEQCAILQKEILLNAEKALKSGGFLIYSTCTFNCKENEENADFITSELNLDPIDLDLPSEWGIMRGINTELPVYRFMPHKTQGEGLFLAVFRKKGIWKPSEDLGVSVEKAEKIKINKTKIKKGNKVFNNKSSSKNRDNQRKKVIEEEIKNSDLPHIEVNHATALSYLRGESIVLPESAPLGLIIITYKGLPLGRAKNIGSRANNLYPKNWRILKK